MKLNIFRKQPELKLKLILMKRDFLLNSTIFSNQKYVSTKTVKRMIEKLFEN